ncbi:MAG: FAD-dependent oxidoreductase [Bacteroidetes bacterium]|nr:FAD-dependent oxidoreductase [Bacteroidota bacterium]
MKIAIIGSGVSGLVSAYYLSKEHDVTIYEKDNRIGGHAHTIFVEDNKIAVDNGFMVFNPPKYPNFIKLLSELGVDSVPTDMSFSVDIPGEVQYEGSFPNGIFADRKKIFSLRYWRFLMQIIKFRKVAKNAIKNNLYKEETLSEFLSANKLSEDLANWYLYPTLSAIWSIKESSKAGDFPALATLIFLNNHRLLESTKQKWRTISGGSIKYVSKIQRTLKDRNAKIMLKTDIQKIVRSDDDIKVYIDDKYYSFDIVIFATHADITKDLIYDIDPNESKALSCFDYSKNLTVLHKDEKLVSKNKKILAAWNYSKIKGISVFTYCMNILQHINMKQPVFVSLNPQININKQKIYLKEDYEHPVYTQKNLIGQKMISELQGKNRTYYAGAYLGYGFHEDGVASAVNVVNIIKSNITYNE